MYRRLKLKRKKLSNKLKKKRLNKRKLKKKKNKEITISLKNTIHQSTNMKTSMRINTRKFMSKKKFKEH